MNDSVAVILCKLTAWQLPPLSALLLLACVHRAAQHYQGKASGTCADVLHSTSFLCPAAAGTCALGIRALTDPACADHCLHDSPLLCPAGASTCAAGSCPAALHPVPCNLHLLLAGEGRHMCGDPGRCTEPLAPEVTRSSSATCWCHTACSMSAPLWAAIHHAT